LGCWNLGMCNWLFSKFQMAVTRTFINYILTKTTWKYKLVELNWKSYLQCRALRASTSSSSFLKKGKMKFSVTYIKSDVLARRLHQLIKLTSNSLFLNWCLFLKFATRSLSNYRYLKVCVRIRTYLTTTNQTQVKKQEKSALDILCQSTSKLTSIVRWTL
jgi:hypothetical protein